MACFPRFSLLLVGLAIPAGAAMRDALNTAQLVNGLVDTCIVSMDLPQASAPPRRIYAVALAFDELIWLYTPGLGTCLLDPIVPETSALADAIIDQLHRRAPAVGNLHVYSQALLPPPEQTGDTLFNGCFVACLFHLARLLTTEDKITAAGVVLFSSHEPPRGPNASVLLAGIGHSVLVYRLGAHWMALDPTRPDEPFPLRLLQTGTALDPELIAHARRSRYTLEQVRFLPFSSTALATLARAAQWQEHRSR
jgi:hypothetical protein